ncbi:MAG TPA: thiamine pyrophosphate-dependent enzyme [Candidatus Azoamicus sp. OHIO2]
MNKDNYFESKKEVKWCPGCGNYSILNSMQKTLSYLNFETKNVVFVSGIGCSGRFPYYMNTNGFHTLHGRAPAVVTGLRLIRPDLHIWLVIGDGDGFSIGLSHLLHLVRRNMNINILFINNKVYALTKGQYSPTSNPNSITKSSPYGSIETPINPLSLIFNAGTSFVARIIDTDSTNSKDVINSAINHKGTSFIEVLQNCNIFNDRVYSKFTDKENKNENLLFLKNNSPLIFGIKEKKTLIIKDYKLIIDNLVNIKYENILHHISDEENIIQLLMINLGYNNIPLPVGIFKSINKECYEDSYKNKTSNNKLIKNLSDIFN